MDRLKQLIRLFLKVGLALAGSFLFLEFLLFVFNDAVFRNSFYMYDPDLGFQVRPYVTWETNVTNEFGFNDRDYPHNKSGDTFRILILSDSFNWAGGLEQNYTAKLERKLAEAFGPERVEVINAGYPGTHPGEYLQILKKFGLQYNPDLVVLGFFVGNDFFDASPWRRRIVVGGTRTDIDLRIGKERTLFGRLLIPQSRFYLFLKEQWVTYEFQQLQQQALDEPATVQLPTPNAAQPQVPTDTTYADKYLAVEAARIQVANWDQASAFQPNVDYVFEQLIAMRDLLAGRDTQFMIVAYPDEFQVNEALRQQVFAAYQFDPTPYQLDRPQGLLWQFSTDHDIEFHDMLPAFQAAHDAGQRLYIPNDAHWNEAGNELAAQYLFDILVWKARDYFEAGPVSAAQP